MNNKFRSIRHPLLVLGRRYVRYGSAVHGKRLPAAVVAFGVTGAGGLLNNPLVGDTSDRRGNIFAFDTSDLIQLYIYLFGEWEPNLQAYLRSSLRDGDVFVDVGANIGAISVPAASVVGQSGSVVSIEASPSTATMLRRNIELNHLDNVRIVNAAVSDREEELTLYVPTRHNVGATTVIKPDRAEESFQVHAKPLTWFLADDEIRRARIVKIDVEGAEVEVLRDVLANIDAFRDDVEIVVEIEPGRIGSRRHTVHDIIEPMRAAGFNPYLLPNSYNPADYPSMLAAPSRPRRLNHDLVELSDIVFSRAERDEL